MSSSTSREESMGGSTDVTQILPQIEGGDPTASEQLLPLLYDELRRLAAAKLRKEKPGQTLQATALVHESYLRLVGTKEPQQWSSRGHFFAAAAEAMRRILVEHARHKQTLKEGGGGSSRYFDLDCRQRLGVRQNLAPRKNVKIGWGKWRWVSH